MVFLPADYIRRYNIPKYDSIPEKFESVPDSSCPFRFNAVEQDRNPDRGFRGELYITLGREEAYPLSGNNAIEFLDESIEKHRSDNISLFQLYVYLSEYSNKPIDSSALTQLKNYFLLLLKRKIRVLLRFAYETESSKTCPSSRLMSKNIGILKQWFADNSYLTGAVVYAAQLGMIGFWGEGHSESKPCDKRKIIPEILGMFPSYLTVMVRQPGFLKFVPISLLKRCSIHDDFLVGLEHPWGMIPYSHKQYPMLLNMNRHSMCDGEMPWGRDKTVENIEPLNIVRQCASYGLVTMSAEHNYKEDGETYCLEKWKTSTLTEDALINNKLPYFPESLTDGEISVFDYLKYHLGYLLAISNVSKNNGLVSFTLYNFGMGIPANFSLKYKDGDTVVSEDISSLTSFACKRFTVPQDVRFRISHNVAQELYITPMNELDIDANGNIKL